MRRHLAAALVLPILLLACGGDDGGSGVSEAAGQALADRVATIRTAAATDPGAALGGIAGLREELALRVEAGEVTPEAATEIEAAVAAVEATLSASTTTTLPPTTTTTTTVPAPPPSDRGEDGDDDEEDEGKGKGRGKGGDEDD